MKDSKDFDMNEFAPESSSSESTMPIGDAQPSKRSVSSTASEQTAPTPSSGQAVKTRQAEQSVPSNTTVSAPAIEPTQPTQPTSRTSTRQRKASLDEYREAFMTVPKIIDRQPVFVSRETRDRIDSIVRRLGERKMSVSGFLENLARHHLDLYADDLEQWKRL
jgi:hypothetical protein